MHYILCPQCQHPLQILPEYIGHRVRCSECEFKFEIEEGQIKELVPQNEGNFSETHTEPIHVQDDHTVSLAPPVVEHRSGIQLPEKTHSTFVTHREIEKQIRKKRIPALIAITFVVLATVGGAATAIITDPSLIANHCNSNIIISDSEIVKTLTQVDVPQKECNLLKIDSEIILNFRKLLGDALFETQLAQSINAVPTPKDFEKLQSDSIYMRNLYARYTVDCLGLSHIKTVLMRPDGELFLNYFFNDLELMQIYWSSGSVDNPTRSFDILFLIWRHDNKKECVTDVVARNLAVACALTAWGDNYQIFDLYKTYNENHKKGKLHRRFSNLTAREMRYIIQPEKMLASDIRDLQENHNSMIETYGGTCWRANYLLNNLFDDSIHGRDYYRPWSSFYGRYEGIRKIGGVCGSLSHYGMAAAKARGVPAITGGQPGHCAYMVRHKDNVWRIHYYVGGPTGMHMNMWGQYNFYYLDLIEAVFSDKNAHQKSMNALVQAAVLRKMETPELLMECKSTLLLADKKDRNVPDFDPEKAQELGPKPLNVHAFGVNNNFAVAWKGTLYAPDTQKVTLFLGADDGAILYINGKELINDDGCHGVNLKSVEYTFTQGTHTYEIQYHQVGGGKGLVFEWKGAPEKPDQRIEEFYKLAIDIQPINYAAWQAYGDYLSQFKSISSTQWRNWSKKLALSMADYQECAWDLIKKYADPVVTQRDGKEALAHFYGDMFDVLKQPKRPLAEAPRFTELLNYVYTKLDNNSDLMFSLFERMLESQAGTQSNYNQLVNWAGQKFMGNSKTAAKYIATMSKHLEEKGGDGLSGFLKGGILEASKNGDIESFQALSDLYDKMRNFKPTGTPKAYFKEPLLSNKGLLQTNATCGYESPESYRSVISAEENNNFHTDDRSDNPWAIVTLPGDANITGIYVRNVEGQNAWRSCPITVSVSEDKQNWKEVFVAPKEVKNEWIIPLADAPKARYIKVERRGESKTFFHLRKILVYGKKLY